MKTAIGVLIGIAMIGAVLRAGQTASEPRAHVARAKAAAGNDYQNLFNFLCPAPSPVPSPGPALRRASARRPRRRIARLGMPNP